MTQGGPASLVDEIRQYIRKEVAAGFLDAREIEESAVDCFMNELKKGQLEPAMLRRIAGVETDKAFAEQLDAQQKWPAVTDCDRLDQAFADLDRSGIVARQNFTCCQNCGHAEIGEEIDTAEQAGTDVIGYAFFHLQNTGAAVETGNLYLYYGAMADGEDAAVRIGRAIVEALEQRGLRVDWNGERSTAIRVKLQWRRRVSPRMAERDTGMH